MYEAASGHSVNAQTNENPPNVSGGVLVKFMTMRFGSNLVRYELDTERWFTTDIYPRAFRTTRSETVHSQTVLVIGNR